MVIVDFHLFDRDRLERVADEMLQTLVDHNLKTPDFSLPPKLKWNFRNEKQWVAVSKKKLHGQKLMWRIRVNGSGKFTVNDSDAPLMPRRMSDFGTLEDAKAWCQLIDDNKRPAG